MFKKIKHWFWWKFKATEQEKSYYDMIFKGTGIIKDGKRIDPRKFYLN